MVKWGFTDDYGCAYEEDAKIDWFNTDEEVRKWKEDKIKHNGGYFKLFTVKKADYNKYLKMIELEKKLAELKKEF